MTIAFRIYLPQWESNEQFARTLAFLKAHRSAIDELALFSDYWHHGYTLPEVFATRSLIMAERIVTLRGEGLTSVGVNVMDTLGHFREAADFVLPIPFTHMVGHDGAIASCSPCPLDPDFCSYITERYRQVARAKPAFIWVDDDTRMEGHGEVIFGCFCPICLEHFAQALNQPLRDRLSLVTELNNPANKALRQAWTEHNVMVLEDLCRQIAVAVHLVDPAIETCLMTIGPTINTYSGFDLSRWTHALEGKRARPGHGFYDDSTPRGLIAKALEAGRQCQAYPPFITDIQYEYEAFPYQKLDKSLTVTLSECTVALAAGCNGIAFNALKPLAGSYDDYDNLMSGIARSKPLWEAYSRITAGLPSAGLWPAAHPRLMANRDVGENGWFSFDPAYNIEQTNQLCELGLPFTTNPQTACVTVLAGRIAEAFSDDELRLMLAGGVLMDGAALQVLWKRNLGELTGVNIARIWDNGIRERLSAHSLNGRWAGEERDIRMSIAPQLAYELEPLNQQVGALSHLVGYDGKQLGIGMSCYQNALGGRVVVLGYGPWQRLGSTAKRSQIVAAADWVARGHLPVIIEQTLRVSPWLRMNADGRKLALVLLNASLDPSGDINLRLRAQPADLKLLTLEGMQPLLWHQQGSDALVTVPDIGPWQTATIVSP